MNFKSWPTSRHYQHDPESCHQDYSPKSDHEQPSPSSVLEHRVSGSIKAKDSVRPTALSASSAILLWRGCREPHSGHHNLWLGSFLWALLLCLRFQLADSSSSELDVVDVDPESEPVDSVLDSELL